MIRSLLKHTLTGIKKEFLNFLSNRYERPWSQKQNSFKINTQMNEIKIITISPKDKNKLIQDFSKRKNL